MKRTLSIILSAVLILSLMTAYTKPEEPLSGVRYLHDRNYEEAIIAFATATEIDGQSTLRYINNFRNNWKCRNGNREVWLQRYYRINENTGFRNCINIDTETLEMGKYCLSSV